MNLLHALPRLLAIAVSTLALNAAQADDLSAAAAEAALADGALAWDVRVQPAETTLPNALRIDAASLDAWLRRGELAPLQAAVSAAGLDLSRDIVVYAEAGDLRARALVQSLQALARGRLHWLVGGIDEWQMSGRPLQHSGLGGSSRLPVPQQLLVPDAPAVLTMAGASLRASPEMR
jgi:3-mercaptopyruvate sulfurtransferase SseA